jgi:hypothetical protein
LERQMPLFLPPPHSRCTLLSTFFHIIAIENCNHTLIHTHCTISTLRFLFQF